MLKIAQEIPGMGAMGTMPAAGAAGAPAPAPAFQIIHSPLDSLAKILADVDFKSFLENNFGSDPKDLAFKIWTMYGGSMDDLKSGKPGKRLEKPQSDDPTIQEEKQKEEYNETRNSRWERLPLGVSINEITDIETLENAIVGGFETISKLFAKPATASKLYWLKAASIADNNGHYKIADKLEALIFNVE